MIRTFSKMNDSLTKNFLIRITREETNRGNTWDFYYSRKGKDTTVADFANTILDVWDCFPPGIELPKQWNRLRETPPFRRNEPFLFNYWYEFKNRKNLLRRWWIKYMIEVESRPLEEYDVASKAFFEKIKNLPPLECVLVLWRVNYHGYISNNFVERIDDYSPGWKAPYDQIPKEKLTELLTTENPEEIDEWLSGPLYTSIVEEILKRRDELFEKDEFDKLRPKFNSLVEKWFVTYHLGRDK